MIGKLVTLDANVHTYEREIRLWGGLSFPARMVILRSTAGPLALLSPLRIESAIRGTIESWGPVVALIAPNRMHHLFLKAATLAYPAAKVLAPRGIETKVGRLAYEVLPGIGEWNIGGDHLQVLRIEGAPYVDEHVFFHWPSRTLLLTDLVFHIRCARSLRTHWFLRAMGAYGGVRQSRLWRYLVRDPALFARSLEKVFEWPFDRVLVAHGEPVEHQARQQLERAWEPFLGVRP